jgi:hypothetical protein
MTVPIMLESIRERLMLVILEHVKPSLGSDFGRGLVECLVLINILVSFQIISA